MATDTLQFERQAVDTAEQELKRATDEFNQQLATYKSSADELMKQISAYVLRRRFWLE